LETDFAMVGNSIARASGVRRQARCRLIFNTEKFCSF
jgi:hypothetical protein